MKKAANVQVLLRKYPPLSRISLGEQCFDLSHHTRQYTCRGLPGKRFCQLNSDVSILPSQGTDIDKSSRTVRMWLCIIVRRMQPVILVFPPAGGHSLSLRRTCSNSWTKPTGVQVPPARATGCGTHPDKVERVPREMRHPHQGKSLVVQAYTLYCRSGSPESC